MGDLHVCMHWVGGAYVLHLINNAIDGEMALAEGSGSTGGYLRT